MTHAAAARRASCVILLILPDKHLGSRKIHHLQLTSPRGMWTLGQFFFFFLGGGHYLFICLGLGEGLTRLLLSAILRASGFRRLDLLARFHR